MRPETFTFFSEYVRRSAGIVLEPSKEYLVRTRLQDVVRRNGFKDIEELRGKVTMTSTPRSGLGKEIVEALTTNETSFFRDLKVYQLLKETIFPDMAEKRKARNAVRLWSAASSSGQEAYSLSMLWQEQFQRPGFRFSVVGTDIDENMVARSREGLYSRLEVNRGLPAKYLVRYFDEDGGNWRVKPNLREMCTFQWLNLHDPFTHLGGFDIVLCRNVLIYFSPEDKKKILLRLMERLSDDGYLILGSSETIFGLVDSLESIGAGVAGVYRKKRG